MTMTHWFRFPLSLSLLSAALLAGAALAKLPPLSDEAKAKSAEAAAKSAWGDKVAAFQLCKSQDRAAAAFQARAKQAGKDAKPGAALPACADPGPFAVAAPASAAAATPATPAAAPAASAAAKKT